MGAFSHKFSIAPIGETTDRIKKVKGVQKRDEPPLLPCQVWWGIVGRAPAVRKNGMFFVRFFVFVF